jgi:uncharacterized protein YndB with AHSA1/START domain
MPDILHRVGINAKPAQVFAALSTIEGIRQWWIVETTGDARLGGLIDFGFTGMKVVASRPGKLVRWKCVRGPKEWLGTEVTFQLKWEDKQTFVLFRHANWKKPVEFMYHCSTKWATFLLSLKNLLERSEGRPYPYDIKIEIDD